MNFKPQFFKALKISVNTFVIAVFTCSVNAQDVDSAGKTIMARGDVNALNDVNGQRKLARRSPIFKVDSVNTGKLSATQLRMIDGGLLSLQEDSQIAIVDYAFNENTKQGSISMSLLKGGLRTVTGALESSVDNYRLNTPIASIGVRGTHYEAELLDGDLYLAGWEGAIDVDVDGSNIQFSLGPAEAYRFAIVRSDGTVEFLLEAPLLFTEGHSNNILAFGGTGSPLFTLAGSEQSPSDSEVVDFQQSVTKDTFGEEFIDNDLLVARLIPDQQGIQRAGVATFDQLISSDLTSSVGEVTNIDVSVTVDFSTASIPTGNLSFNDNNGEWFAAFNGLIRANALDLNVNFASHNNNLADGFINGLFIDSATSILGNVNLFEVNQPTVQAAGSFIVTERAP